MIVFLLITLFFSSINVFAYSIDDGANKIEYVINNLEGTDYSFKYNSGSSAKASYHVFYKGKMIGYIYATKDGITLGEGWDSKGELGIFFNQKDLTIDEIVNRFLTDKNPLGESGSTNINYKCSGNSKVFFNCLSDYTNKNKNSSGEIYLFDGNVKKEINITFGKNIILENIDINGEKLTCNIDIDKKNNLINTLGNWQEGKFSNKDFNYASCTKSITSIGDKISTSELDNLLTSNDILGKGSNLIGNDNIDKINNDEKNNLNYNKIKVINNSLNNTDPSYNDGLKIINDTKNTIILIDKKIKDKSLKERMLLYRKIWNKTKIELYNSKNKSKIELLKEKYLYKSIEKQYKLLFKEYVLTFNKNSLYEKNIEKINFDLDNNNNNNNNNNNGISSKEILPDNILKNFIILFNSIKKKYNKEGNYSEREKNKMNYLFNKIDSDNKYNSISDFFSNNDNILNNMYNIELLQKLIIITCNK